MNQFTFESKQRTFLLGGIILGVVCLLLNYFVFDDAAHTRTWSNFLLNAVFFTGLGIISLFSLAAFTAAMAGWHVIIKRLYEAFSLFMIPGLVFFIILSIGLWMHSHHLYHWAADPASLVNEFGEPDQVILGKSSFLNKNWYTFGTIIILGFFIFVAKKIRTLSLQEEDSPEGDYSNYLKIRRWSGAFLPIFGYTSLVLIWEWVMSVDAHWYSTLFGWYATASWFIAATALMVLVLIYLKSKGYYPHVNADHFHDLGKYIFAISIFWTYLWFSQYMLIWYSNNGEETVYFFERKHNYPILFWANLVLNFVLPFFVLMRNDTKRKYGTLALVSILVFIGHWLDFFLMVKPGVRLNSLHGHASEYLPFAAGFTLPGLLDIGIMIGFLSGFLYFVFNQLSKAPLEPTKDPFIQESLHHHV